MAMAAHIYDGLEDTDGRPCACCGVVQPVFRLSDECRRAMKHIGIMSASGTCSICSPKEVSHG